MAARSVSGIGKKGSAFRVVGWQLMILLWCSVSMRDSDTTGTIGGGYFSRAWWIPTFGTGRRPRLLFRGGWAAIREIRGQEVLSCCTGLELCILLWSNPLPPWYCNTCFVCPWVSPATEFLHVDMWYRFGYWSGLGRGYIRRWTRPPHLRCRSCSIPFNLHSFVGDG